MPDSLPEPRPATTSARAVAQVIAITAVAVVAALLLISALNGPTEAGLRCARSGTAPGVCQVLRSRFFGLFGNVGIPIPEADIRSAKAVCTTSRVGRASSSCNVYVVDSQGGYLVLSYPLQPEAERAADRINAYLADKTRATFEIRESVRSVLLLRLVAPALVVGVVLGLRAWALRRRARMS